MTLLRLHNIIVLSKPQPDLFPSPFLCIMPPAVDPPLDTRTIRVFLNVAKVSDFMKHARRCPIRAFHRPHVDAGQDAAKPWCVFMVTEKVSWIPSSQAFRFTNDDISLLVHWTRWSPVQKPRRRFLCPAHRRATRSSTLPATSARAIPIQLPASDGLLHSLRLRALSSPPSTAGDSAQSHSP